MAVLPNDAPATSWAAKMTQYSGALVSVALIAGAGVWGYKLLVRDAHGVPVVRAMEGPMRQRPDVPGGELALHTGLAVNAVVAEGTAAPTEERLALAPGTPELSEEDLIAVPLSPSDHNELLPAEEDEVLPAEEEATLAAAAVTLPQSDQPLTADEVMALADQIAGGADPLAPLEEAATEPVTEVVTPEAEATPAPTGPEIIPASTPGVARAMRPPGRPATLAAAPAQPVEDVAPAEETSAIPVRTEGFAPGTTVVQLGAFPTIAHANRRWGEVSEDFADFVAGREPVIQQAVSAGETFYRLRATGFADLADARRFCTALVAEDADCIPLVTD